MKKKLFIMKNEKKKFVQKIELGYCPNNIVRNFLYCKAGLYCSLGSLEGLKLYCKMFMCVAIQWSAGVQNCIAIQFIG